MTKRHGGGGPSKDRERPISVRNQKRKEARGREDRVEHKKTKPVRKTRPTGTWRKNSR